MRWMPWRERPRRGAWRGSRGATAGAAACLATVMLCLTFSGPAYAYRCGAAESPPDGAQATAMFQECKAEAPPARRARPQKRGSMSSLTVLVLAIAAVSLIPIGARGIPSAVDPFRYEEPYE